MTKLSDNAVRAAGTDDDYAADATIRACLDLAEPRSFFLFAGAGSGKTRSLVGALEDLLQRDGERLRRNRQSVAVVTYTNAAAREIEKRLAFDPRIEVSTLHSFAGRLVAGFHDDIRTWLGTRLESKLAETKEALAKGKSGTKIAITRSRDIERMEARLIDLPSIQRFVYDPSPTARNSTRDAFSHAEAIAMASDFIETRRGLRAQLVARHPIMLIDESQDTLSRLIDALLNLEVNPPSPFALGLFGDTMQRIFPGGKADLVRAIPDGWARPSKRINHRCPKRVVELVNAIRTEDDGQVQIARVDAPEGHVRLFLAPPSPNPAVLENEAREHMADATDDADWIEGEVKMLALEHRIAALRQGYGAFFDPLHACDDTKGQVRDGTGPEMTFLRRELLPLLDAIARNDRFATMAHLRQRSPHLTASRLESDQLCALREAQRAVENITTQYWNGVSLGDLVKGVSRAGLMEVPNLLLDDSDESDARAAWAGALRTGPRDLVTYDQYVNSQGSFDTHQGIKGLEFPRVLAVLSDAEAKGRVFQYEKLLTGDGTDASLGMIRNLFYVICSRASKSLALVLHTSDPGTARVAVITRGFFAPEEIVQLGQSVHGT